MPHEPLPQSSRKVPLRNPSRRNWLRAALGVVVTGGIGLALGAARTSGYAVAPAIRARLRVFEPSHYWVVRAAARRMLVPDRAEPAAPSPDELDVAGFADRFLLGMPADRRRDFLRFLQYLEHAAPLASGRVHRFTALSAEDQDRVLEGLSQSRIGPLKAGFEGLKGLVMMGYYRSPRAFVLIGYPGPLVAPLEDGPAPGSAP